jgi:hypothetical protein
MDRAAFALPSRVPGQDSDRFADQGRSVDDGGNVDDGSNGHGQGAVSSLPPSLLPTALDDVEAQFGDEEASDPCIDPRRAASGVEASDGEEEDEAYWNSRGGDGIIRGRGGSSHGGGGHSSPVIAMPKPRLSAAAVGSAITSSEGLSSKNPVSGGRVYVTDKAGVAMTSNVGTVAWCAPEIFNSGAETTTSYSLAADSYSFGMCLYELAERRAPFDHLTSRFDIVDAVLRGDRPAVVCPLLTHEQPAYRALLEKCWAAQPERRPAFAEIVDTLEELYGAERAHNKRLEADARNAARSASSTASQSQGGHQPPRVLFDLPMSPRGGPAFNGGGGSSVGSAGGSGGGGVFMGVLGGGNARTASMHDYMNAPSYFDGKAGPGRAGYAQTRGGYSGEALQGRGYAPLSSGEETPPPLRGGGGHALARFIPNLGLGLFHQREEESASRRRMRQSF